MLDKHIIADEVSHLLKTKYKNTPPKDIPFNLAFTDVADKYHVLGESRGALKSEIGSILGKRPRKAKGKNKLVAEEKKYIFTTLQTSNTIEFISEDKITFRFGKSAKGIPMLYSYSGASMPSESLKKAAQSLIKKGTVVNEGLLNMVEMAFRVYDPCFGCATHSLPGQMPLQVTIYDAQGNLKEVLKQYC